MGWALGVFLITGIVAFAIQLARPKPEPLKLDFTLPVDLFVLDAGPETDSLTTHYLGDLQGVAEHATPLCRDANKHPVDNRPSPAIGTALERDPSVLQVEVWCKHAGYKDGFAGLKQVPDARRLGGTWPQKVTSSRTSAATITVSRPASTYKQADEVRYETDVVEIDLEITKP